MSEVIKTAFLIDDEKIDQRQYERVLMRSGLIQRVEIFTYADEALEHLISNPSDRADVIFLDINMPRMDGFQFLEQAISALGPTFTEIVVAMLTTSLDPSDYQRAMSFGVVKNFINKPLTKKHVEEVAELLLEK